MGWQREVLRRGGRLTRRVVSDALADDAASQARRMRVDPHWRRLEDGYAARLGPRDTIDVKRPVGHWRSVDPRRPHHGWRSIWKFVGLVGWAGAVGTAWWVGSSRGRGPLAGVRELDHLGDHVGAAIDGFGSLEGQASAGS